MEAVMTERPETMRGDPYANAALRPDADYTLRPGGLSVTREMAEHCGFAPGTPVLDVGCGAGATVAFLRERFAFDACGIDSSTRLISFGIGLRPHLPIVEADARSLPFVSGCFDCVVAECSLSVIGTADGAVEEISRVLKDGGILLVSDVYLRAPERFDRAVPIGGAGCLSRIMSRDGWTGAFASRGFSVQEWTDRSELLPPYVARTMMAGSGDPVWCGNGCDAAALKAVKPGYFTLFAKKEGRS